MSDAIYEVQLVGQELRAFEALHGSDGAPLRHCLFLDGKEQWGHRMSDLRRAVDLLCGGLIDDLVAGRAVLTDWPPIVEELCDAAL
jgi:hypothetical protein